MDRLVKKNKTDKLSYSCGARIGAIGLCVNGKRDVRVCSKLGSQASII